MQLIDRVLQWLVDAFAIAMMRRFGVGKVFVRYTFMSVGSMGLGCNVVRTRDWKLVPIWAIWLWLSYLDLRKGERYELAGLPYMNPSHWKLKMYWVFSIGLSIWPWKDYGLVAMYFFMLLTEYLRDTPNKPPPKEERRVLKTADASA